MRAYIGITDKEWYRFLQARPDLDEVNFWQPGGNRIFSALSPGEPFLFKLHSPDDFIVGGGFFAHSTLLPVSLGWEAFEDKNGVGSLGEMRSRVEKYRRIPPTPDEDYRVGCVLLEQPFFFQERDWIPAPSDWPRQTVQGKTYPLDTGPGGEIWNSIQTLLAVERAGFVEETEVVRDAGPRYGSPYLALPRLGQGSFRVLVMDAYERRCAITGERTLPVLEAAHIQPFCKGGPHRVDNGLFLREDLHTLFDKGYVTVTADHRIEVSRRIKEEFENGRDYYAMHGKSIRLPADSKFRPRRQWLEWHNAEVFRR